MITLSLDISSACTGVAVLNNSAILYNENIKLKQKTHPEKLLVFEVALKMIIKEFQPQEIIIEDCWRGRNIKTFKILSLYHGVAYKTCYECLRRDPVVMMPSEIRKIIGAHAGVELMPRRKVRRKRGDGSDSKQLTFNLIKKVYELDTYTFENNNDQTDAIAVAVAYNLVNGDESTRSLFGPGTNLKRKRGGSKEIISEPSVPVPSGPKPRKQRSRRKVQAD